MEAVVALYQDYGPYLWLLVVLVLLLSVLWLIVLQLRVARLRRKYAALLTAPDGKDLGELLSMYVDQMQLAASKAEQLAQTSERMGGQIRHSIKHLGLVRFNAYEGIGGEKSFSVVLLDDNGDGVVLSSLHGRGEGRLYAKPIAGWDSTYTLSVEEKQAITQARGSDVDNGSQL